MKCGECNQPSTTPICKSCIVLEFGDKTDEDYLLWQILLLFEEKNFEELVSLYKHSFVNNSQEAILIPRPQLSFLLVAFMNLIYHIVKDEYEEPYEKEYGELFNNLIFQMIRFDLGKYSIDKFQEKLNETIFDDDHLVDTFLILSDRVKQLNDEEFYLLSEFLIKHQQNLDNFDFTDWFLDHVFDNKKYEEAISILSRIEKKDSLHYSIIGLMYISQGEEKHAWQAFDKAVLKSSEDEVGAIYHLITMQLFSSKQYEKARLFIERALEKVLDHQLPELYFLKFKIEMELELWDKALNSIKFAYELDNQEKFIEWIIIALVYNHKYKDVLEFTENKLRERPEDEDLKFFYNVALFLNKDLFDSFDRLKELHDETEDIELKAIIEFVMDIQEDIRDRLEGQ